jgi:excisionase family DNA binding protein
MKKVEDMNNESEKLLTVAQVAEMLSVSEESVRRFATRGSVDSHSPFARVKLHGLRVGRNWRFSRGDLEEFLRKLNPPVETEEDREQRREAEEATRRLHKRLGMA